MIRVTSQNFPLYMPNIYTGVLTAISGYFAPIKHMAIVMLVAIVLDLFFGVWAARVEGQAIKSKKLWRTCYKALFALIIIHLLHSIDVEMGIAGIQTCKVGTLFITGFEVWSILESAAVISDHPVFRALKKLMNQKVKENTGYDLEEN